MVGIDPNTAQAIQSTSKFSLLKVLSFSFLGIYIFLLLINTLYVAIEQHSIAPVLKNVGDTFLLTTQKISEISRDIVANDGGYVRTPDFWTGVWHYICMYASLYIYLYTIYVWFLILMWLYGHSPLSDDSSKFKNFSYALVTFIVLQSVLSISYAAVSKTVDCFTGCEKSVIYYIELPVVWIVDFLKAIPLIIKPATIVSQTVVGNSTI